MITVTWVYERLSTTHDFYKNTVEGGEFQNIIDSLRDNSGLVSSHVGLMSPDNLTYVSIYRYEDKNSLTQFTNLILGAAPEYFKLRNLYINQCGHRLTGTCSEPTYWFDDGNNASSATFGSSL